MTIPRGIIPGLSTYQELLKGTHSYIQLQVDEIKLDGNTISNSAGGNITFTATGTGKIILDTNGNETISEGTIRPSSTNTHSLGNSNFKWSAVYTEKIISPEIQALIAEHDYQCCYDGSTSFENANHKWVKVLSGSASITPNSPDTGELTIVDVASTSIAGYYKSGLNFQPNDSFIIQTRLKQTGIGSQFIFRITENDAGGVYKNVSLAFNGVGGSVVFCGSSVISLDTTVYHEYTVFKDKQNAVYLYIDGVLESIVQYGSLTSLWVPYPTTYSFIGLGHPQSGSGSGTLVCDYYKYSIFREGSKKLDGTSAKIVGGSVDVKNQAETEGIQISSDIISTTGTNQDLKLAPNGTGNILPDTDNDISLGNSSYRFRDGFFSNSLVSANSFIKAASGVSGYVYFYEDTAVKGRLIYESSATRFMVQNLVNPNTYLALYDNGVARLNSSSADLILGAGSGFICPASNNTHNLGSTSSRFKDLYTGTLKLTTNEIVNIGTGSITLTPASGETVNSRATLLPYDDDTYDLGSGSYRWNDIYATNDVIQTSDERLKTDIKYTDLGLDFINTLTPVSYRFKEGKRPHYGLIAQDIERLLEDKDFAGLIYNEKSDRYGLRYAEFIAPMIAAIQELNKKVEKLEQQKVYFRLKLLYRAFNRLLVILDSIKIF